MKRMDWRSALAVAFGLSAAGSAYAQRPVTYETPWNSNSSGVVYIADDGAEVAKQDAGDPLASEAAKAPGKTSATKPCCEDSCDGAPSAHAKSCDGKSSGCSSGCGTCDSGCGCNGLLDPCCELGDAWKLFDCPGLECRKITVAGWLAQSFTWNTSSPSDRFNGPVTWTDRSNEYQLNQLYLYAERATDTGGCGWDLGYRADVMYGTDARFTTSSGLEVNGQKGFGNDFGNFVDPKWSTQRFYGTALPQLYAEVARNNLKVKVGHFYSPVGYEVVPTTGNFFTTLPYTFQYGEPFTHTGVLGTWQLSEKTAVGAGFIRGWNNWDNFNPNGGYIGTFTHKFDNDSSLAVVAVATNELTFGGAGFRQRYLQTNVYSVPLSETVTYVAQSDIGYQNDALAGGQDAEYYGLNQYLFKKVSDCWTWGVRAEWFRDDDGYVVGGFLGGTQNATTGPSRGLGLTRFGYAGDFYEVTIGANWKPTANTTVRPMVRFDWYDGLVPAANLRPFDNGTGNSQTLLGFDVVTVY